mmetsp:Transcript_14343/g.39610  ORF Transcript_14343/g.39610 Transcript_14343/m.39610 type:complete len:278 (-) Transcript_14343:1865-2698(-)
MMPGVAPCSVPRRSRASASKSPALAPAADTACIWIWVCSGLPGATPTISAPLALATALPTAPTPALVPSATGTPATAGFFFLFFFFAAPGKSCASRSDTAGAASAAGACGAAGVAAAATCGKAAGGRAGGGRGATATNEKSLRISCDLSKSASGNTPASSSDELSESNNVTSVAGESSVASRLLALTRTTGRIELHVLVGHTRVGAGVASAAASSPPAPFTLRGAIAVELTSPGGRPGAGSLADLRRGEALMAAAAAPATAAPASSHWVTISTTSCA